jgi:hypothetical protein
VFVRFGGIQKLAGFCNAHLPGRALIFRRLPFITVVFVALGIQWRRSRCPLSRPVRRIGRRSILHWHWGVRRQRGMLIQRWRR